MVYDQLSSKFGRKYISEKARKAKLGLNPRSAPYQLQDYHPDRSESINDEVLTKKKKKKAQTESCELSFMWAYNEIALRNCCTVGGVSIYI